jgi:hypothetical protein
MRPNICHQIDGSPQLMAFFSNDAVNRVNMHYGIRAFAQAGAGVFFLAYLIQAGVPASQALLAQAGIIAGRFIVRPVVLPLAKRWGLKPVVIAGTVILALAFPILGEVKGVGPALIVVCIVWAVGDALYWTAYHAYFSILGDSDLRGHQVSAREAMSAIVSIVAPISGAAAMVAFGPSLMFAAAAIVQASAAIPLWRAPNIAIKTVAPGTMKAARHAALIQVASGWSATWTYFVWTIVLFLSLEKSIAAFGGAAALAALVGAIAGLGLGRHIDKGNGAQATLFAFGFSAVIVLVRVASDGLPMFAIAANALATIAVLVTTPSLGTIIYNHTHAAPCPLRFQMATEGSWDIGVFSGCLVASAVAMSGFALSTAILLALPAQLIMALTLRRAFLRDQIGR